MAELNYVTIYTDGACSGNPGPGGYAVILKHDAQLKEISGGFKKTTNNRMEIMAAIIGLKALKQKCRVTVYSDSRYLVDSVSKGWVQRWQENGWMRNKKDKAINPDLWAILLQLISMHEVEFKWVEGHNNHPENERCDQLATEATSKPGLPRDEGYENTVGKFI